MAATHSPPIHPPAAAWPHAAQLAAAFLLGAAAALPAAVHLPIAVRPAARPGRRPADRPQPGRGRRTATTARRRAEVAGRIVDARDSRGGFESADDIRTVSGIGPWRDERLRPWVRAEGEAPAVAPPPAGGVTVSKKVDSLREAIDPNVAAIGELTKLPGVGPKLAQRIVDERDKRPFASIEDLRRVSGIGPKTLEKLRPFVAIKPRSNNAWRLFRRAAQPSDPDRLAAPARRNVKGSSDDREVRVGQQIPARRRSAAGHREARRGLPRWPTVPDAARSHGHRQDVSPPQCHRPTRQADARPRPQQDARRPALQGISQASFPHNAVHYFVSYYDYYQPEAYIPQRDIYIEKDASSTRTSTVCVSPRRALVSREEQ